METLRWDRAVVIDIIRDQVWLYLSPASTPGDLLLQAAALLQLNDADVGALGRLYFLLSNEVQELLEDVPGLLRRLPTNLEQREEWSTERVRGVPRWGPTLVARLATGLPHLFVSAPAERAFDTPENELIVFMLSAISRAGKEIGWDGAPGSSGRLVADRRSSAERWSESRMLSSVRAAAPSTRSIARIKSGRHGRRFATALRAYAVYESFVEHADVDALKEAIEARGLVVQPDGTLFEILCLFRLIDDLRDLGWQLPALRVFHGGLHCQAQCGPRVLDLWYQTAPPELRTESRYRATLTAHGFVSPVDLRPDMVIRLAEGNRQRWLLIEAKTGWSRGVEDNARSALLDLLGYGTAFGTVLDGCPAPYGLGIAWGAKLPPKPGAIMLSTPDHMTNAMQLFLET